LREESLEKDTLAPCTRRTPFAKKLFIRAKSSDSHAYELDSVNAIVAFIEASFEFLSLWSRTLP